MSTKYGAMKPYRAASVQEPPKGDESYDSETKASSEIVNVGDCEIGIDDVQSLGFPTNSRKGGCMICREEVTIETFDDLKPGDHIATRGQICCLGCFYDHHAIVTDVKKLGSNTADIIVVDVHGKGDKRAKSSNDSYICCGGLRRICRSSRYEYPIEEHKLFYKTWGISCREESGPAIEDTNLKTQKIKRIHYKKRRNNEPKTIQIAQSFVGKKEQNELAYHILEQNCEHFATACVNGPEKMTFDDLKDSISLQSRSCCWRFLHLLFWLLQGSFYAFNFYIYAVFVAKDESFDFFSPRLNTFLSSMCYHPRNCLRGFDTTCDWLVVAIFVVTFAVIFTIALLCFYQPLYIKGFICRQCLIIARLDCFSRIFAFVIIEAVSIFLENPAYKRVTGWRTGNWALLIILSISLIGAFTIYSVSSLFTWVLGMCCVPTCKGAREFIKYFHFRGIAWLFAWLVRCCKRRLRRAKRKARETL